VKRALFSALLLTTASAAALPSADAPSAKKGTPSAMPVTADDVAAVLSKLGSEDRSSAERLERLSTDAKRVHALLLARGRSYVKLARAGLLPIGGGLDALVDHASRIERLRRALSRDIEREKSIAEERVLLVRRRASLDERRSTLETEQAALERSHTAILAAEDREAAFRQAFVSGGEGVSHTAVYGGGLEPLDQNALASGFAGQKGHLPFPLQGRVEVRRVKHSSADGPGLEMASPAGGVVRAVYPGRVAFADSYADYGRAVIVDHGSGYYTVSANLAAIDVRVGDELSASDRIGSVAPGASLYLELRRGATTVNPASWFGI
jgi:septal ring factor EnvC (AmiA/AmiB activator)